MTAMTTFQIHALRFIGLAIVAVVLMVQYDPTAYSVEPPKPAVEHGAPVLVEQHGCWTGEAPTDVVIPGHVVISEVGEAPRYAGSAMVGKALDQIFAGEDHGLTVHAFCR